MPMMPAAPCSVVGCTHRVPCPVHKKGRGQKAPRPSSARRGYGRHWRRVQARVLEGEPLCRDCCDGESPDGKPVAEPATEVHHIKKLSSFDDPRDAHEKGVLMDVDTPLGRLPRWVGGNLMPLCRRCHNVRTRAGE